MTEKGSGSAKKNQFLADTMNKTVLPKTVEYRGSNATTYLQNSRNTTRYEVRYYDVDGAQQRLTFATCEAAKEFAEAAVREIANNRSNFITLRGQEAYDYQQVVSQLSATGLSVKDAANLVLDSVRLLNGTTGIWTQQNIRLKIVHENRRTSPFDRS